MSPENRWVKKHLSCHGGNWGEVCKTIPQQNPHASEPFLDGTWITADSKTAWFFRPRTGEEITENPYLQYFIGLPAYQTEPLFVPSLLVEFGKRLSADVFAGINEMIIDFNNPDDQLRWMEAFLIIWLRVSLIMPEWWFLMPYMHHRISGARSM